MAERGEAYRVTVGEKESGRGCSRETRQEMPLLLLLRSSPAVIAFSSESVEQLIRLATTAHRPIRGITSSCCSTAALSLFCRRPSRGNFLFSRMEVTGRTLIVRSYGSVNSCSLELLGSSGFLCLSC